MGILILWLILSIVVGAIGKHRKIGFWAAFLFSLILSPLIGLIIAGLSKRNSDLEFEKDIKNKIADFSVPERLEKLVKLKENGHLTEEEFQKQKMIILGGNPIVEEKEGLKPVIKTSPWDDPTTMVLLVLSIVALLILIGSAIYNR